MQCVLAVRETVVIKPSRLNIVAQGLSNSLPDSPYTHLSLSLSKKRSRTHRQVSLMVSRYTTLVPPLRSCIGPAHEAGLSTGTEGGTCHLVKERKRKSIQTKLLTAVCLCVIRNCRPTQYCGTYFSSVLLFMSVLSSYW